MRDVKIWDPFLRLFHWTLVLGFTANAFVLDEDGKLHEWAGYAVLGLIALRLLWGLIGPASARFAGFLPGRTALVGQITDIATRRARAHLGHSPLGALMIVNLLATILAICVTGHLMTTDAFKGADWVEDAHEALELWAEMSVAAHVAAVIWESRRTGVNLPRAMITGRKRVPERVNIVE